MSAEDIIREIAPGVARRRVRRGYLWLLQKTGGFHVPLGAHNPHTFVPQDQGERQTEHVVARAFTNASEDVWRRKENEWRVREWLSIRIHGRVLYRDVVHKFLLSPQFLLAHGFEPDHIITASMLNFVWHEALWEMDYPAQFARMWAEQNRERPLNSELH
jgi:hypothetical protein